MIHPRLIPSSLLVFLLITALIAGCQQKQSTDTQSAPDTDNLPTAPAHESSQRQPAQQYIASTPANATISRQTPLDISNLLQPADLKKITDSKQLQVEDLAGQSATADYNALRIVMDSNVDNNQETSYGVGLQIWKFPDIDAANRHLDKLKSQYLGVQELPAEFQQAAAGGFISERGNIRNYLLSAPSLHVIAISCDKSLCTNWSDLLEISKIVQSRL